MGGGGGLLGKATDFVGITNHKGQKADAQRADSMANSSIAATQANIEMQREQLQFLKDQYADWKDVYGDLQKNLGDYYKGLSVDREKLKIDTNLSFTLQALATEYAQAEKDTKRQMAQAGIGGSGIQAASQTLTNNAYASERARARAQADVEKTNAGDIVAQKQMGFLGLGLGQGTAMLSTITQQSGLAGNAYGQLASTAAGLSGNYMQRGWGREQSNISFNRENYNRLMHNNMIDSFQTSFGQTMGQGMGGGLLGMMSDFRLKDKLKFIETVDGFNIYEWEWNNIAKDLFNYSGKARGVIAQELLQHHSDKVRHHKSNYLMVDYTKLPISVQNQVKGY